MHHLVDLRMTVVSNQHVTSDVHDYDYDRSCNRIDNLLFKNIDYDQKSIKNRLYSIFKNAFNIAF